MATKVSVLDRGFTFRLRPVGGQLPPSTCRPAPYCPRTALRSTCSGVIGLTARRALLCSSRTASASKEIGGSIATRLMSWKMWLGTMSRKAPERRSSRRALHPQGLGDGDLHVVDVAPVPDRLEDPVGEAEDQQVLHGLFAQVVIDPVDPVLLERAAQLPVQLAGRGQVAPEGFLHHHPPPAVVVLGGQPAASQLLHHRREQLGGGGQVEEDVALGLVRRRARSASFSSAKSRADPDPPAGNRAAARARARPWDPASPRHVARPPRASVSRNLSVSISRRA